ncbi:MAG: ABC transporter ATP-binding protein [Desulfobacula sp.]|uniref:ABC transporter ATP-binding protein n=1 Tax=Desulfobacula sp. TaxID=2593537 RepID=UPI0025BEF5A6|nr:ABC transporter ATP-binding protein [Desulfobacula sp.]MCD4721480.1 ABC transporter ATP-binding protein [Desulfobacula sp.]
MIKVNNLSKHFGGIRAVDKVNLHIKKGSITGLIGPNGAGKTTLFNLIAGLYKPTSGKIYLEEEDITGLDSHNLFHKGLLRTFQIAHPFPTLTVLENLMMVPGNQLGENIINSWFRRGQIRKQENKLQKKAEEVIKFLNIMHLKNEKAGRLSGGQKKLLELARVMMVDARVVLLDEVGAGVNRTLLRQIGDAILRLNSERGYTFCMIEHDMDFISKLCNPVIVLTNGQFLIEGTPEEVKNNEQVIDAYLGRGIKEKVST